MSRAGGRGAGEDGVGAAAFVAVPDPAGGADGVDAGEGGEVVNREARDSRVAAPLVFTRHDDVEVELGEDAEALGTHGGVDAGEGFVEHDEARGVGRCTLIMGGGGGETRQGQREGFFAAGASAVGAFIEAAPLAVLLALDDEAVPGAVVEGE